MSSEGGSDRQDNNFASGAQNLGQIPIQEGNFFNFQERDSRSSSGYQSQSDTDRNPTGMSLANQLGCMEDNPQQNDNFRDSKRDDDDESNEMDGAQEIKKEEECSTEKQENVDQQIQKPSENKEEIIENVKPQQQQAKPEGHREIKNAEVEEQKQEKCEQKVVACEVEQIPEEQKEVFKDDQINAAQKQKDQQKIEKPIEDQKEQVEKKQQQQDIKEKGQETNNIQKREQPVEVKQEAQKPKVEQKQPQQTKIIETKVKEQSQSPVQAQNIVASSLVAKIQGKQQAVKDYQKQLEDDMHMLKQNLGKKKKSSKGPALTNTKKEQKNDKNRLNKTMMPSKVVEFDENDDIEVQELKMIAKMAHEKKKENYQLLKEWDKRRAQKLALHRNLIEMLQTQVDKRIKSSIENIQIYQTFFTQKARQEQKYVSHPIINTRYALQNNSLSKNVYINCSVILNSLSDQNQMRCRRINDFIHLIRSDILKEIIENHLTTTQRELLRARQKISTLKNSLRKYNQETEDKTGELAVFFNENAVSYNLSSDKDFYAAQLDFIRIASKQTSVQKKLGEYCLQYYNIAIAEQNKRSKVIREAMVTFTKGLSQCYSVDMDPAQIEQLSKAQQTHLISQFYSLDEIIEERLQSVFKKSEKMKSHDEMTLQIFQNYLKKFDFEPFDNRLVLLKQFNVKQKVSIKNEPERVQTCLLVITVDRFIHLFINNEKVEPYAKPDVTVKIDQKNLEFKSYKDKFIEMIIKDERRASMLSYFWEAKNDRVYKLQFNKKDSREEFLDFVSKLKG